MKTDEIFTIPARRCARCGGLLTSESSIKDGYGHSCKQKMRNEQLEKEAEKDQICLFEEKEDDYGQEEQQEGQSSPAPGY